MSEEEIFQDLKGLIKSIMPSDKIDKSTMDSDLRNDLEIDSFRLIHLAILIEEHFKIQLDEGFTPKKVRDVCQYISGKL